MAIPAEHQGLVDEYNEVKQEYKDACEEKETVKNHLQGIPNAVTAMNFLNDKIAEVADPVVVQQLLDSYYDSKIAEVSERLEIIKGVYHGLLSEHGE